MVSVKGPAPALRSDKWKAAENHERELAEKRIEVGRATEMLALCVSKPVGLCVEVMGGGWRHELMS